MFGSEMCVYFTVGLFSLGKRGKEHVIFEWYVGIALFRSVLREWLFHCKIMKALSK